MRKHWKLHVIVTCLAGAALALIFACRESQPTYQGRPLSDWAALYRRAKFMHTPPVPANQCREAIETIGTNALPCLVQWIAYEPRGWQTTFYSLLQKHAPSVSRTRLAAFMKFSVRKQFLSMAAADAFEVLGEKAAPALPALSNMQYQIRTPFATRRLSSTIAQIHIDVARARAARTAAHPASMEAPTNTAPH